MRNTMTLALASGIFVLVVYKHVDVYVTSCNCFDPVFCFSVWYTCLDLFILCGIREQERMLLGN